MRCNADAVAGAVTALGPGPGQSRGSIDDLDRSPRFQSGRRGEYGALMSFSVRAEGGTHDRVRGGLIESARTIAHELLNGLGDGGRRWRHTQAVATRAALAAPMLGTSRADALVAAAWLHDTGYAPHLVRHGFHPVDGAEYATEHLSDPLVAGLVAHHSGARFVAAVRGLSRLLLPFDRPEHWTGTLADALTWADQTTDPEGAPVSVEARLDEMLARHGADSPNAHANPRRAPVMIAAVRATEARLQAARGLGEPATTERSLV